MPSQTPGSQSGIREFALASVAGVASALLWISPAAQTQAAVFLSFFAPLPLFIIGLSLGWQSTSISVGFGFLLISILAGPGAGLPYIAFIGMVPIVLCRLARQNWTSSSDPNEKEWYPEGRLLAWTAMMIASLFALTILMLELSDTDVRASITEILEPTRGEIEEMLDQQNAAITIDQFIAWVTAAAPGVLALYLTISHVVNGIISQSLLASAGNRQRPDFSFVDLQLPDWLSICATIALMITVLAGSYRFAAGGVAAILLVPHFLLGLTVVHAISRRWMARGFGLGVFYLLLVITGWPVALVLGLGLAEQMFELKRRLEPSLLDGKGN